mmetsp:Transcript_13326/g.31737  ORF Transcript_13326/g.31737 Transcript_13326/m.31737 type:complete len:217 (-) Transcript_13326:804-1454(-)
MFTARRSTGLTNLSAQCAMAAVVLEVVTCGLWSMLELDAGDGKIGTELINLPRLRVHLQLFRQDSTFDLACSWIPFAAVVAIRILAFAAGVVTVQRLQEINILTRSLLRRRVRRLAHAPLRIGRMAAGIIAVLRLLLLLKVLIVQCHHVGNGGDALHAGEGAQLGHTPVGHALLAGESGTGLGVLVQKKREVCLHIWKVATSAVEPEPFARQHQLC